MPAIWLSCSPHFWSSTVLNGTKTPISSWACGMVMERERELLSWLYIINYKPIKLPGSWAITAIFEPCSLVSALSQLASLPASATELGVGEFYGIPWCFHGVWKPRNITGSPHLAYNIVCRCRHRATLKTLDFTGDVLGYQLIFSPSWGFRKSLQWWFNQHKHKNFSETHDGSHLMEYFIGYYGIMII